MPTDQTSHAYKIRDLLRVDYAKGRAALDEVLGKPSTQLHPIALRALLSCHERGLPLVDRAGVYIDGVGQSVLDDLVLSGLAAAGPGEENEGWALEKVVVAPDHFYHVRVKEIVMLPSYIVAGAEDK